jgi:hypothetical protein
MKILEAVEIELEAGVLERFGISSTPWVDFDLRFVHSLLKVTHCVAHQTSRRIKNPESIISTTTFCALNL